VVKTRFIVLYAAINCLPHYPPYGKGWGNLWGNVSILQATTTRGFELRSSPNDTCPVGVYDQQQPKGWGYWILHSTLPNPLSSPIPSRKGVVGHAIDSCIGGKHIQIPSHMSWRHSMDFTPILSPSPLLMLFVGVESGEWTTRWKKVHSSKLLD
jgi:hypothetical protein